MHLRSLRFVLDQLDQVVAVDDLARRRRGVLTEDERRGVDLSRPATVVAHVVDEIAGAFQQTASTGFEGTFERCRIGRQEVGRRERVEQEAGEHPRLFGR